MNQIVSPDEIPGNEPGNYRNKGLINTHEINTNLERYLYLFSMTHYLSDGVGISHVLDFSE